MKKIWKNLMLCLLLTSLLSASFLVSAQEDFYTVSGIVKDKITRKPMEYATVLAVGNNIGTVSNTDGEFALKIPFSATVQYIEVSYIGYYNFRIPVKQENISNVEALLTPYVNALSEVVIRGWDARYLMQEAVNKIAVNYSDQSSMLTGFYRETIQKKRNYISISEAVIDIYKTSYNQGIESDRVQVLKGRKLLSQKKSDTLAIKLLGGPNLAIFVDIVKNPDILLDKETLSNFSFKMEDETQLNGRAHYIVKFSPQVERDYPLYYGIFYIDKETLTFSRAEFYLDMNDKDKASNIILRKKPLGLRFRPEKLFYVVSYREYNGKSYLSYIRNELEFKCDWKRRLFYTTYAVVSEMVTTDMKLDNVTGIGRKESFRADQSLSEEAMAFYDDDFWGVYNIIEPTESLESAVAKLKKQRP